MKLILLAAFILLAGCSTANQPELRRKVVQKNLQEKVEMKQGLGGDQKK